VRLPKRAWEICFGGAGLWHCSQPRSGSHPETGKILRLLSNDLDAPAQEIADLYKRRWAIELFFRWVKQNLKIGHFLGTSENAVRIQIAVALIAYLLLSLARQVCTAIASPLAFTRLVRHNIMHRRALDHLQTPHPPPKSTRPGVQPWLNRTAVGQARR
jgi:hypothetical protein